MRRVIKEDSVMNVLISSIIIFIFGVISFIFALGLFSFRGEPIYFTIAKVLISIAGLMYIISGIFLFRLKNWPRKLALTCSAILLFYFVPLSIILITDPWGWAQLIAPLFLPYMLFPLFFIIFFTRPKIKEQFKKQ